MMRIFKMRHIAVTVWRPSCLVQGRLSAVDRRHGGVAAACLVNGSFVGSSQRHSHGSEISGIRIQPINDVALQRRIA